MVYFRHSRLLLLTAMLASSHQAFALDQHYAGSVSERPDGLYLGGVKVRAVQRAERATLAICSGANLCEFKLEMPTDGDLYKYKSFAIFAPFKSPKDVLDTLYKRVAQWDQSVFDIEDRDATKVYTKETAALIVASNEKSRKLEEESPAHSPWLTAQEWDVRAVKIDVDELGDGRAMGIVRYRNLAEEDPKPTTLTYDLQDTPEGWRIADITYPYGTPGENRKLSDRLRRYVDMAAPATQHTEAARAPAQDAPPQRDPRDKLFEQIFGTPAGSTKPSSNLPPPMTMPPETAQVDAGRSGAPVARESGAIPPTTSGPAATLKPPVPSVRGGASFPNCSRLADFPIDTLGSVFAYGDKDKIIESYFSAKLTDWADADVEAFKSRFITCREADENFHRRFLRSYFLDRNRGPVAQAAELIRERRAEQLLQAQVDAQGQALLDQVQALGIKARDLSATEADIARLEQLKTESEALWRKMLIQNPRSNPGLIRKAASDADEAVRAYRGGIESRRNAEIAEKQRALNAKKDAEQSALQLLIVYAMTDYCADRGAIFTKAQTKQLQSLIKVTLDQNNVPQEARDKTWVAAQQGIKMSGLEQMYGRQLESECNGLRTTLMFSMPQIFASPDDVKKNPF